MKRFVKQVLYGYIVKKNFDLIDKEIQEYAHKEGVPALVLKNGFEIQSLAKRGIRLTPKPEIIPESHEELVYEFMLRYIFPHYDPSKVVNTGFLPRAKLKYVLHPQHLNAFLDLKDKTAIEPLKKIFTLNKTDRVLELGCFLGLGSLSMSLKADKILSIEANPVFFKNAQSNLSNSGVQNIRLVNCAVGDVDNDKMTFWVGKNQANSLIKTKGTKPIEVPVKTVNTLLAENSFDPTFIVLTINGFELKVLKSMSQYLKTAPKLRIVCPGWYHDETGKYGPRIINHLKNMGLVTHTTPGFHIFAYRD